MTTRNRPRKRWGIEVDGGISEYPTRRAAVAEAAKRGTQAVAMNRKGEILYWIESNPEVSRGS